MLTGEPSMRRVVAVPKLVLGASACTWLSATGFRMVVSAAADVAVVVACTSDSAVTSSVAAASRAPARVRSRPVGSVPIEDLVDLLADRGPGREALRDELLGPGQVARQAGGGALDELVDPGSHRRVQRGRRDPGVGGEQARRFQQAGARRPCGGRRARELLGLLERVVQLDLEP